MQVVGVLESAGMEFDCLWVGGLTEENWPLKARPHPFLPVALQRKAGIPEAAAETSLALDRRITQGWLARRRRGGAVLAGEGRRPRFAAEPADRGCCAGFG